MGRFLMVIACGCALAASAHAQAQSRGDDDTEGRAVASREAQTLGRLVYTDLSLNLDGTTADVAFALIEQLTGARIHVRFARGERAGIDPQTLIHLDVFDRPALEVLERVLEQCAAEEPCTWQFTRGRLEAGLKSDLARPGTHRSALYDVNDLVLEPIAFDNAPNLDIDAALNQGLTGQSSSQPLFDDPGEVGERLTPQERLERDLAWAIRMTIEPEIWLGQGGRGRGRVETRRGALVVGAPDFVHRKLAGYDFEPAPPRGTQTRRAIHFMDDITIIEDAD